MAGEDEAALQRQSDYLDSVARRRAEALRGRLHEADDDPLDERDALVAELRKRGGALDRAERRSDELTESLIAAGRELQALRDEVEQLSPAAASPAPPPPPAVPDAAAAEREAAWGVPAEREVLVAGEEGITAAGAPRAPRAWSERPVPPWQPRHRGGAGSADLRGTPPPPAEEPSRGLRGMLRRLRGR